MSGLPFVLLSLALAPTGRITDSVRTLTAEELALYRLAVRDLVSASSTAAAGVTSLVLDPTVYAAPPVGAQAVPLHAMPLADATLVAVLRETGIDRACGPVVQDACEGRGGRFVLRLSEIRRFSPDSVRVVLRLSGARAAADPTPPVPLTWYYVYDIVHAGTEWTIRSARRGLRSLGAT